MQIMFETPDELFCTSVILTRINHTEQLVSFVGEPTNSLATIQKTGWHSRDVFGFITSDVKSLSSLDKICLLQKVCSYGMNRNVEFLFNVYQDVLCVYVRDKAPAWGN